MKFKISLYFFILSALFLAFGLCMPLAQENPSFKVMVVFSYDETMPWVVNTKEGIEKALSPKCEIRYVYLDTRNDYEGGKEKARQAFELYQEFQPDGVIVSDDDAQTLFTVPYLKDKVKTPVMFCGVNKEPEAYGYPASNVSGILERIHIAESIAFLQQIVPSVKSIAYLMGDIPTSKGYYEQINKEKAGYSIESKAFKFVKNLDEAVAAAKELKTRCDALFIENMIGLKDKEGKPLSGEEVIPALMNAGGIPTIGANIFVVKFGLLCAVVKTGQDQGETSANMLLKAMQGTPVSDIPVTRNYRGKQVINVTVANKLGIEIRPDIIGSAELVRSDN